MTKCLREMLCPKDVTRKTFDIFKHTYKIRLHHRTNYRFKTNSPCIDWSLKIHLIEELIIKLLVISSVDMVLKVGHTYRPVNRVNLSHKSK